MPSQYIPGVCNIGPAETNARRRIGLVGTVITVLAWILLLVLHAPTPLRLLLFLPAAAGATGLIQAKMHFCAGFGVQGLFNFGDELGKTETAEQAEFRAKDRRTALLIALESAALGVLVTAISLL